MITMMAVAAGLALATDQPHPQSGDPTELLDQARVHTEAGNDVVAYAILNQIRSTTQLSEDQKLRFLDLYLGQHDHPHSNAADALAALASDEPCLLHAFAERYEGTPEARSVSEAAGTCPGPFDGLGEEDARPRHRVAPEYPRQAVMTGLEGSCMALFDVTMLGRPRNIAIRCSDDIFYHPMREAIRQWRYEPARIDGEPVWRRNVQNEMNFALGD